MSGPRGLAPSMFVFIGAIALSLAVNIYTSAFGHVSLRHILFSLLDAGVALCAAAAWTMLGWSIEGLTDVALREAERRSPNNPEEEDRQVAKIVDSSIRRLSMLLIAGAILSAVSLGLVPFTTT